MKKKVYIYYIGIDVSKLTLDFTVSTEQQTLFHRTTENEVSSINSFIKELKAIKGLSINNSVFGMEQTGIYCNYLKQVLTKAKANFVIDNPLRIKNSLGIIRGKTDKMDSKRIAEYLIKHRLKLQLYKVRRPIIEQLAGLLTLRTRLVSTRTILRMPLKEDQGFINKEFTKDNIGLCANTIAAFDSDIKSVDARILEVWSSDSELRHKMKLILSVPSIGPITALQMLIASNEFLDITSAKKFASYCGVAPFPHKSGTTVNKRTENSSIANKKVKSLIHSCAIVAITHSKDIRQYYLRKISEGKSKMSVLNAVRYKLICRVFSCVNENRMYEKDYSYKPKVKYKLVNATDPKHLPVLLKKLTFLN